MTEQKFKRGCTWLSAMVLAVAIGLGAFLFYQARRPPAGTPVYVALGSSYAAGAGLGPLQKNSPLLCGRSVNGYPQQLAHMLNLPIVDMSCGGATAVDVLEGGQFFQGPQIRAIGSRTRIVTITVGGNDVNYVGDLSLLAARNSNTPLGALIRRLWSGPKPAAWRDYAGLRKHLISTMQQIHVRSPKALVVIATYPTVLPPSGTCRRIQLSDKEADLMRDVGDRLAASSAAAALETGALLVNMHVLGRAHSACSPDPWISGWINAGVAKFHPTLRGAEATADAIAVALRNSPAGVAAIRENDASGHEARRIGR